MTPDDHALIITALIHYRDWYAESAAAAPIFDGVEITRTIRHCNDLIAYHRDEVAAFYRNNFPEEK